LDWILPKRYSRQALTDADFSAADCIAQDKIIGGYLVPAKTPCIVDVWRINTNEEAWGPDAELFRPERFAGLPASSYRFSMIRWGVGTSKCMGKNMADLLLKMTVVEVLERFELRPALAAADRRGEHVSETAACGDANPSKTGGDVKFRAI
jgi:cytochrome P450 monooxygenase